MRRVITIQRRNRYPVMLNNETVTGSHSVTIQCHYAFHTSEASLVNPFSLGSFSWTLDCSNHISARSSSACLQGVGCSEGVGGSSAEGITFGTFDTFNKESTDCVCLMHGVIAQSASSMLAHIIQFWV